MAMPSIGHGLGKKLTLILQDTYSMKPKIKRPVGRPVGFRPNTVRPKASLQDTVDRIHEMNGRHIAHTKIARMVCMPVWFIRGIINT